MRGSSEPSYSMFVKSTNPEIKANDFRFHPYNPDVSGLHRFAGTDEIPGEYRSGPRY